MRLRFVCPGRVLDVPVGRGVLRIYIGLLSSLYPILLKNTSSHPVLIHASHHTVSTPPCFHLKRCVGCTLFSYCLVAAAILRFLGLSAMTPESESFTKSPPTLMTALLHVTHESSSHSAARSSVIIISGPRAVQRTPLQPSGSHHIHHVVTKFGETKDDRLSCPTVTLRL